MSVGMASSRVGVVTNLLDVGGLIRLVLFTILDNNLRLRIQPTQTPR